MTKLAACHASTEAVVADADRLVLERICEIVSAFRHGSDKDAYALIGSQTLNVVLHSYNLRIETEGDFSAILRKVVRYRVLDDFEELLLGIC